MDPNIILSISTTIAGCSVLLLYRGLYTRICNLETTSHNKVDAEQAKTDILEDLDKHAKRDDDQFQAVQAALREMKADISQQFVTLRTDANDRRTEMRNDIINLRGENNSSMARIFDLVDRQRPSTRRR